MPHVLPPYPPSESVPPIPPRTRTHPRSNSVHRVPPRTTGFRLEELPSPDREWQLLENIGDGTYGEVFRVSFVWYEFQ